MLTTMKEGNYRTYAASTLVWVKALPFPHACAETFLENGHKGAKRKLGFITLNLSKNKEEYFYVR